MAQPEEADAYNSDHGVYWQDETDPEKRGPQVQEVFDAILDEQSAYRQATLQHMRMYRNLNMLSHGPGVPGPATLSSPLSLNVVRNMTNAVHSKITKHRVKTTFQTIGGSWEMREKARMLDAYGLALTVRERLPQVTPKAFLDTVVIGHGIVKTYKDGNHPCWEWVFAPNLIVDFAESAYGDPAHYYEIKYIDKRRLAKMYPDKAADILAMKPVSSDDDDFYLFQNSPTSTMIRVIEALYLNPEDEFDGKLCIVAQGKELAFGAYRHGNPYSVMRWGRANMGWHGMGLAEELRGIQIEINRLVRKVQTAFALLANPYVLVERSANIARAHITDIPGSVIHYSGMKPPTIQAPQTTHPEVFAHLDRLYQRAYEIAGISQLSAQSQKPASLESGRAMLVYEDVEADRFADVHRQWDDLHVSCVEKAVRIASKISGYTVKLFGSADYEEINFKEDIDLKDDEWSVYAMPTALLGETPPAQIDNAERLIKAGLISKPEELLQEMTAPDVAAYVKRLTAPKRLAEKLVGNILKGGPYIGPEPQMNLALTLDIAQSMYLEAKLDGAPEKRLSDVRKFMLRCEDLLKVASQTAPPTMGAGAMVPPGAGMPPPPLPEAGAGAAPMAPPPMAA